MVSWWRDRESFKAYMRRPEDGTSHDGVPPELRDQIKPEQLENVTSYAIVAE